MELDLTAQIGTVVNIMSKAKTLNTLYDLKIFIASMDKDEEYEKKTEFDYCEQLGKSKALREVEREISRIIEKLKSE